MVFDVRTDIGLAELRFGWGLAAADVTLSDEELTVIGIAISELEVVGNRYPELLEQMTGL